MPLKSPVPGKNIKIAVLGVFFVLGIVLMYYRSRGTFLQPWRTLLPFGYAALAVFLSKILIVAPKRQSAVSLPRRHVNIQEIAKSVGCIAASFVWAFVALPLIGDTTAGVIVLAVPCFLFAVAGLFFLSRSF
jgi:hypothetical protein